jgi:hypothetical protein
MTALQIVHSLARLQCTKCGAEANASCNCGEPYKPVEIAKEAIKASPQKSNRAIAKEIGVSEPTVRRARASGDAPENVVGLDGKTYKAKGKPVAAPIPAKNMVQGIVPIEERAAQMAALADDQPPALAEPGGGAFDFVRFKQQLAELAQHVERLTPAQAREVADLAESMSDGIRGVIYEDDQRKRAIKEAKNPEKTLDAARKNEQHWEKDDERNEAKREARQNGESWSDAKDAWEANWLTDNWDEKREQKFLERFKANWRRDHGQEFPASDFAQAKGGAR